MPTLYSTRKVGFSRDEVKLFRLQFPCSGLRDRAYWFEFDANGDLVDTDVPEQDDGSGASALSYAAQMVLDGDTPSWLE